MSTINKSAIVPFSVTQMFELVNDINRYCEFLPWCDRSRILSRQDNTLTAEIGVNVKGLKNQFTTRNELIPQSRINLSLVAGPFSSLTGYWSFEALREDACKVSLVLNFTFSSRLLSMTVGPVFNHIAESMVDAFCKRAHRIYPNAGAKPC